MEGTTSAAAQIVREGTGIGGATMTAEKRIPLTEVYKIQQARGLQPIDYKHLPYSELLKLAGVKQ